MNPAFLLLLVLPAQRPLHANLEQTMAPVNAKLAAGDAQILLIGDSLSRKGWNIPFTAQMQGLWGNAGSGYQGLNWHNEGGFNGGAWDAHNIGEDREPHSALDGLWAQTTAGLPAKGAANHAVLTPWQLGPFDLHYESQPGGGRFNLLHDTSSGRTLLATIDTASDAEQVSTWSGVSEGRLVFQPLDEGKPVKIFGIVGQSDAPGVRIDRAATDAWGTVEFAQRDWTFEQQASLLGTDLAIIALGANDASSAEAPGYRERLETIADRVLAANPDAQIILMPPYHYVDYDILSGMTDDALSLAQERGFGFVNLHDSAGTPEFFAANDFLRDWIHWNEAGAEFIADEVTSALRTLGASLDNPICDVTGDHAVDFSDFAVIKENFGATGATIAQGDATRDAKVDLADFARLRATFGASAAAAVAAPEPSAWLLSWLAIAALVGRRAALILLSGR